MSYETATLNSLQRYAIGKLPGATPRGNWIEYNGRAIMSYSGILAAIETLQADTAATRVYTDNGASKGLRTRYFRDCQQGGVEWMFAVDYAAGERRWYGFGMAPGNTIASLIASGMDLRPL